MVSDTPRPATMPEVDFATLPTPSLSPCTSGDPSPAFATVIKTPDAVDVDEFNFDLGEAALATDSKTDGAPSLPECWGHRGASAAFPENTCASFVEACKAGADGIETDIHFTSDNVLVMFHDPELSRTTDGTGRIGAQPWHGVLEHVRTTEEPHQPIPLFTQVLDILMQPENARVKVNIDCKVESDPVKLFGLIKAAIESYKEWETRLAPRMILGLWHPFQLGPAASILPFLPRYAISMSLSQLRRYFFPHCHGYSVMYEALASADGAKFRKECQTAGKAVCAWTVNDKEEMMQCARWGITAIITDKPELWRAIKQQIIKNRNALKPTIASYVLPYLQMKNYHFSYNKLAMEETEYLEREAGSFDTVVVPPAPLRVATPGNSFYQ